MQLWDRVAQTVTPLVNPQIRASAAIQSVTPPLKHEKIIANNAKRELFQRELADRAMLEQLLGDRPQVPPSHLAKSSPAKPVRNHHPVQMDRHIEPRLRKRITRGREEISQTIDLHGMRQDEARHALINFLHQAQDQGARTVLVITGKGKSTRRSFEMLGHQNAIGDGVLRRMTPQWLHQMPSLVSGVSDADRHHGGSGALYVRLKRKGQGGNRGQGR